MEEQNSDACCEIGVKGPCGCCDFSVFCKGKWSTQTSSHKGLLNAANHMP
ncbi:MAG: hypothetical protein NWE93_05885 [Candidatus Bathyarchaeota archaeon]|nr:hypothetical protein [Candidatus Bathyarchaeota archaeon]